MTRRVVDVVVEIPKGSRNKYEFDGETAEIRAPASPAPGPPAAPSPSG